MAYDWLRAPITQGFGPTSEPLDGPYAGYAHFNKGLDYGTQSGTPIDVLIGGTVLAAGDQGDGWGISVKVKDRSGNVHNYGHLGSIRVKAGDVVGAGTIIGISGNSGHSTGPHLSYDVMDAKGNFVDPSAFVRGNSSTPEGGTTSMPDPKDLQSRWYQIQDARARLLANFRNQGLDFNAQTGELEWRPGYDPAEGPDLSGESPSLQRAANLPLASSLKDRQKEFEAERQALDAQERALQQEIYSVGGTFDKNGQVDFSNLDNLRLANAKTAIDAIQAQVSLGQLSLAQGNDALNKLLLQTQIQKGQQSLFEAPEDIAYKKRAQAENRANLIEETLLKEDPWRVDTGSTTSIRYSDLGQGFADLAKSEGKRPDDVAGTFFTRPATDMAALLRGQDEYLGVAPGRVRGGIDDWLDRGGANAMPSMMAAPSAPVKLLDGSSNQAYHPSITAMMQQAVDRNVQGRGRGPIEVDPVLPEPTSLLSAPAVTWPAASSYYSPQRPVPLDPGIANWQGGGRVATGGEAALNSATIADILSKIRSRAKNDQMRDMLLALRGQGGGNW